MRNRIVSQGDWSIHNTQGRESFAAWRCRRCCSRAITLPSPAGGWSNRGCGADWREPRNLRARNGKPRIKPRVQNNKPEEAMKNKLMALVEETALKKEVPSFEIG